MAASSHLPSRATRCVFNEKVELLTHSLCRITLSEPIQDISGNQPKSQKQPYRAFEHYPTIIALLRSELEKERASHARTHDTAELEILTLRAQLARREAVLEECLVHSNIPRSTSKAAGVDGGLSPSGHAPASSKPKVATKAQPQANLASRITPEEASQLLRSRAEKNRRLEAEIKEIAVRVCSNAIFSVS